MENCFIIFSIALVISSIENKNTIHQYMYISVFIKIPPPGMAGGYPCFLVSLAMIGLIVIVVGIVVVVVRRPLECRRVVGAGVRRLRVRR